MTEAMQHDELLLSFQLITDTHIREDNKHIHNIHFRNALLDIIESCPLSKGIMHAGDVTDHGYPAEFKQLEQILNSYVDKLPPIFMATGNHDVGLGEWEDRISRFLSNTAMKGPYHDHWIEGHHFIFLGTEENLPLHCALSEEQLAWLDERLSEQASDQAQHITRPAFVFLHQPIMNTTAGSFLEQDWYGVREDEALRTVLAKHPHAIMFTGHTHWELEAANTYFPGTSTLHETRLPVMLNAASVAYLWTDEDEHKDGSQGYFIEVYQDRVLLRGRDFITRSFIEAAQYEVKF